MTFFWKNYGSSDLRSGISILTFFLLCIGSAEMLPSTVSPFRSGDDSTYCRTEVCMETAASILKNMNPKVDPCDNFYQYACGNFINNTLLKDDENFVNYESILRDEILKQLKESLNTDSRINETTPYRLAKSLYKSCMNTERNEEIGIGEIADKIKNLGGWPVVEGNLWNETNFDWLKVTSESRKFGYSGNFFFDLDVSIDIVNSRHYIMTIKNPTFDVVLGREEVNRAYLNYMMTIAQAFGASQKRAEIEMGDVLRFQMDLANVSRSSNERNALRHLPIFFLSRDFTSTVWLEYIQAQMPDSLSLGIDEIVLVSQPKYIPNLELLLERTPKRTIANYFMWKIVSFAIPYGHLTKSIEKNGRPERWRECLQNTKLLPVALSSIYVREHLSRETFNEVLDIMRHVKEQFVDIFHRNDRLDYKSQVYALAKLAALSDDIEYPIELTDDKKLDEYYEDLELSEDLSYLENVLRIKKFNRDKRFEALLEPVFKNDFRFLPDETIPNAFYASATNFFHINVATMSGPFFDKDRPKYVNYGTLGTTIGHEIAHAFDSNGVIFNKNGNMEFWIDKASQAKLFEGFDCVVDQYSNYTQDEDVNLKVDGKKTLDENIADILGMKTAYKAYIKWVKEHGEEKKLPGIERSPNELFWLSTVSSWCTKTRSPFTAYTDEHHASSEIRIFGSFSDSPEFAQDFKCPLGSKMNPIKRCKVW